MGARAFSSDGMRYSGVWKENIIPDQSKEVVIQRCASEEKDINNFIDLEASGRNFILSQDDAANMNYIQTQDEYPIVSNTPVNIVPIQFK
jgi:hypothetical protein